ncbi:MAG: NADP oxidoreductase, partial [Syntrophobacteraceae bacterium]|nr:NADP oxidoreductase [Syntrophobacteraceae bacterium]
MSFLDLDERLIALAETVELVYSPIADIKKFPEGVDVTLVEGAVANSDHIKEAKEIREKSKIVIAFGDCAVTGNVPSLRNRLDVKSMINSVYWEGPGKPPPDQDILDVMPVLLPKVVPLHQIIPVDIYLPGCPPDPERIWAAITALLKGEPVALP